MLNCTMKNYYTPKIDEFHVGFEYEIKDWWTLRGTDMATGESDYSGFTERILTEQMLYEWRTRSKEELNELQKKTMRMNLPRKLPACKIHGTCYNEVV